MANRAALRKREEEEQEFERRQRELLARVDQARKLENTIKRAEAQATLGIRLHKYFTDMGFEAINPPDTLPRVLKTRNPNRLIEVYMGHMFERYPVPAHLRSIFSQMKLEQMLDPQRPIGNDWADAVLAYFVAGRGGSLFKEVYKGIIAKKECHYFLTAPAMESYKEAMVFAIARSFTDNIGLAKRISKCRHLHGSMFSYSRLGTPLHRETIRFFANHPAPLAEMSDLCDYIFREAVLTEDRHFNPQWSFTGRSLPALRRSMKDWHYALARAKKIGGGSWSGLPLEDMVRMKEPTNDRSKFIDWAIFQIKTGNDLAEEGTKMRHCVGSYKHQCIGGRTGIFSLRVRTHRPENHGEHFEPPSKWERSCTVEVSKGHCEDFKVVQVKRLANYAALPHERAAVENWARQAGLGISGGAFGGIRQR